jgi:hypothetical protein
MRHIKALCFWRSCVNMAVLVNGYDAQVNGIDGLIVVIELRI